MPSQLGICSISLGRCYAGHSFDHKLDMAAQHGFRGIELFHEDLYDIAEKLPGGGTRENEIEAAKIIRRLCRDRNLTIICLQPFWHYEALVDRQEHAKRIEKLKFWFLLAQTLGTDLIQVPSNYLSAEHVSDDFSLAVSDLQKIADMGLTQNPPIRFVYEAIAWGARCNTWEKSWETVQAVDRSNFGLCFDTFNIAARIYADPTSPTGCTQDCDKAVAESIARLLSTVDVRKIMYVQVVDAQRLAAPLVEGHELYVAEHPARMSWSRACRLFYGETDHGAYLPITAISKAIFQGLGFEGWVSMELFNRRMADEDPAVPQELASRGAAAWAKLVRDMDLKVAGEPEATERAVASL
ncbi:xylose isomerase-like TIM barrel [Microdochium bolleyi]|uniref:Xylose isomerase-like TIM barrel n=1 Tax=Microdochium bolleyi TaxID=196109 RepID=A0A136IR46_9PEZI|nr:xylose isomerase-like TIM barrel [Microdochium bolleyi]